MIVASSAAGMTATATARTVRHLAVDLGRDPRDSGAAKRRHAGGHLIEQRAGGEDIAPLIGVEAVHLFRRQIWMEEFPRHRRRDRRHGCH